MYLLTNFLATASCSRCHQPVDAQAVKCPYCRAPLKAYGHPGIPLHRTTGEVPLCQSCLYDADDTCNFPQRPEARECTLYQNITQSQAEAERVRHPASFGAIRSWVKRHQIWLILLGLLLISFMLAL